jgi:hypothetical protein
MRLRVFGMSGQKEQDMKKQVSQGLNGKKNLTHFGREG